MTCPFCPIPDRQLIRSWDRLDGIVAFEPLNPVVPGHVLIVPRTHVANAAENTYLTGAVMECAAQYARDDGGAFNIITSIGADATQSVFHLHVHLVPRTKGDGLKLPWTDQLAALAAREADLDRETRR